ncbi:MAG: class I SAM-dependent methyltransferase [Planctomycetia bacterium]|nr:class I SAM-dependent methyltransferase [Planctomycetia bacterium]
MGLHVRLLPAVDPRPRRSQAHRPAGKTLRAHAGLRVFRDAGAPPCRRPGGRLAVRPGTHRPSRGGSHPMPHVFARLKRRARSAMTATDPGILDAYCMLPPGPQQVLDLFRGEWSSAMPAGSGLQTLPGTAALFEDDRVTWAIAQAGGVRGRRILEIGPLEGGHSCMLERAGAAEVLAVEANTRSYLKCLCVKEVFGLRAVRFVLGDCMAFMEQDRGGWDMVFASGVLYHMQDPMGFLTHLPKLAPRGISEM